MNRLTSSIVLAGLGLIALCGGCQALGAFARKTYGPMPIPPKYTPPKTPIVVLVESPQSRGGINPDAEALGIALRSELAGNNVAPTVEQSKVLALRDKDAAAFSKMSVSTIGKAVGASQVLYVELQHVYVDRQAGGDLAKGKMIARVKVVDATTSQTAWPPVGSGEMAEIETPFMRIANERDETTARQAIILLGAQEIAKWFYPYRPATDTEGMIEEEKR